MDRRSLIALVTIAAGLTGCRCGQDLPGNGDAAISDAGDSGAGGLDAGPFDGGPPDGGPPFELDGGVFTCGRWGAPARPFDEGDGGARRGALAGPFELPLLDGGSFSFRASFTGCDVSVFVPGSLTVSSASGAASVWDSDGDLRDLVDRSPPNARYFFVSRAATAQAAAAQAAAMQGRVDAVLAALPEARREHWRGRLIVSGLRAAELQGWLPEAFAGAGSAGFAIDRRQRLRGLGSFSDVTRFRSSLQMQSLWPWESNLALAAYEVDAWNLVEADALAAERDPGQRVAILEQALVSVQQDVSVEIPKTSGISQADALQVEVALECPDPGRAELVSCGAWDRLARLELLDGADGGTAEIARFVTPFHREARWKADATPLLARLGQGGPFTFRWSHAPSFAPQPTVVSVGLRFLSHALGRSPSSVVHLFSGGTLDGTYNQRAPVDVPIPATAKRVELWATISGHGNDAFQCGEFCDHQHAFTVGTATFTLSFPDAGSQDGCVPRRERGMTPNQGGTWWFGRGGWCPGAVVEPAVFDVTSAVTPGNGARVTYRATLGGNPLPDAGQGFADVEARLVVFE
ncbi:MAG: hypothetical protein K1X89_26900 [Myxococcaceae bacterium]|nr:hypothetical protein [Myxococcaceae bacterium]